MNYNIYLTHELIMEGHKCYSKNDIKYAERDFDRIDSIKKLTRGHFYIVKGLIHLYGYKIAGESPYCGFYDVINQEYYTRDYIKNAEIIEHSSEFIYHSPVKPKTLRKL